MTKKLRIRILALCAVMCIMVTSITVHAIDFDVTPPGDPYSRVAKKNDSEQKFYVTGVYFSKNTSILYAYSQKCSDHSVRSYTASISKSSPKANKSYKKWASSKDDYEMFTYSSVNNFNVSGRYTP